MKIQKLDQTAIDQLACCIWKYIDDSAHFHWGEASPATKLRYYGRGILAQESTAAEPESARGAK